MQASDEGESSIYGINITPLVDVAFVLLIIFMATAPMIARRAIKVDLPKTARHETTARDALLVSLDGAGRLALSGKRLTSDQLQRALALAAAADPDQAVTVAADRALPYGDVATLLDSIRGCGIRKVGLEVARK